MPEVYNYYYYTPLSSTTPWQSGHCSDSVLENEGELTC